MGSLRDHGAEVRPAGAAPLFDPRPREFEQWLAALPMANIGETARRLYGALRESNARELPSRQRLRLLESLQPVLQHVRLGLCKHYLDTAFPLPRKAEQVAALSRELCLQMASGYRVLLAALPRRRLFAERGNATLATHRAISLMGQALLPCYQTYGGEPAAFWRILHELYRGAEVRRLHMRGIGGDGDQATRISTEYKRVLLFALAAPYRLRPGEVAAVHRQLARWAEHARLRRPGGAAPDEYCFAVPWDEDAPPRHLRRWRTQERGEPVRVLDTGALDACVRRLLAEQDGPLVECAPGERLGRDLLLRLLASWGAPVQRGFPRARRDEAVEVALGLSATHHFVLESAAEVWAETGFEDRPARFRGTDVKNVNDTGPDVWDLHYTARDDAAPSAAPEPPSYRLHCWRTLNVSPGGWALRLQSDGVRVQVGELVGMRPQDALPGRDWSAGVVRWIRRGGGPAVELGVELLERDPLALGVRAQRTGQPRTTSLKRALLLPGQPASVEPSLLVPPLSCRDGDTLEATGPHGGFNARLGPALEHSGGFSRYRFTPLPGAAEDGGFSALWSEL